jgi:hypothetical protein
MAAANESQGLKIAVAAFVSLTVILAVTSYFLYSNYSQSYAKLQDAEKTSKSSVAEAIAARENSKEMRAIIGYPNVEDHETFKTTIKKDNEKLLADVSSIVAEVKKIVSTYQEAGGSDPKIKELEQAAERIVSGYTDEPNKTYASSLARLRDLLSTQALLTTEYAVDNLNLRAGLASSNTVNEAKLQTQMEAVQKSKTDLENEHSDNEKTRQDLIAKVDKLQTEVQNVSTDFENLKTKYTQLKDDSDRRLTDFRSQLTYYKDLFEKQETVMDAPDGHITAIDYTDGIVRTDINKAMGVRPQMKFAVFDQRSPIPNDHPKAWIEIISLDANGSVGKIMPAVRRGVSLQSSADIEAPIRQGDYVYSNVWSPNSPARYALIGKIDLDRDGRDDREDLKRLIEASGGIVEYDLPPAGVGRESGKLTSLCSYYVRDERPTLASIGKKSDAVVTEEETQFLKKESEAMREARSLGVRPIPIERLLTYLGYSPFSVTPGRLEQIDRDASDALLNRRGRGPAPTAPAPGSDTPPAAPGGFSPVNGNFPAPR